MPPFEYLALDPAGRERSGVVAADSEAAARSWLAQRRLMPVSLAPGSGEGGKVQAAAGVGRLTAPRLDARTLALITRQLATLIAAVPLEEALRTIASQADRPAVAAVMGAVHTAVLEGRRLSDAMTREPRSFPALYRAMVAAGEASSALPAILERLAHLAERDQEARSKVTSALVYPIALAATALVVVGALMVFVVPKVVEQFDSMGRTLPLLTRIIIGLSTGLRQWGWLIALLLAIGGLAFGRALRNPAFRLKVDGWILTLPLIGRLTRDLHAARLARTLSTMIASGLPVVEGLAITAPTVRNAVLRQATEAMVTTIREGGSLSAALRRAGTFPPLLVYMAASGESGGQVDAMLARAAEYLEREFNTFTAVALSLLEPVIIVVMGALVALIVLSILLPILQINTLGFN